MAGIESLAITHMDLSRPEDTIKVCTHYKDRDGNVLPYQPGLRYIKEAEPIYIELPGWDGKACQNARSIDELPENAKKFLSFVQARTGYPIIAATTGPSREQMVKFRGYNN